MNAKLQLARATALIVIQVVSGCGEKSTKDASRKAFDALAHDAASLYISMHPLRASRLGIAGADSMLFTFSPPEIERAMTTIDTLMEELFALPADDLDIRRVEESLQLSDWMKGERFVFTQSRTCLDNPLLYCWMIEETLFDVPMRPWRPEKGERIAWSSRLKLLPFLVENASALLRNPDGTRLELASRRLKAMSERLSDLIRTARKRYGDQVVGLDGAVEAVARYRTVVDSLMTVSTRGRLILGMEELSRMLKYSEHLDFDPEKMATEAEKITRRLSRQIPSMSGSAGRKDESYIVTVSVSIADSLLGDIEERSVSRRTFGQSKGPRSPVAGYNEIWRQERIPINSYLTPPAMAARSVRWTFDPDGRNSCLPRVYAPTGRELWLNELIYNLLLSSSLMTSPGRKRCGRDSFVNLIFCSETFHYAWKALNSGELTGLYPERRIGLGALDTRERLTALARMIVVFRLHSGKYTTEGAKEYLREVTSMPEEEIDKEVTRALISPASAFEGIAMMTVEAMIKKATASRGGKKPRARIRALMLESSGMPPYYLMKRISS